MYQNFFNTYERYDFTVLKNLRMITFMILGRVQMIDKNGDSANLTA